MQAATEGDIEMVRAYLALGVPIDACAEWAEIRWKIWGMDFCEYKSDTALVAACRNGYLELAEFLLENGADRNHSSCTKLNADATPVEAARRGGHWDNCFAF